MKEATSPINPRTSGLRRIGPELFSGVVLLHAHIGNRAIYVNPRGPKSRKLAQFGIGHEDQIVNDPGGASFVTEVRGDVSKPALDCGQLGNRALLLRAML
jgi:hypothetical protein